MNRKDKYYIKAKKDNLRSRAAFKLMEIQEKFNVISENSNVLEIGASPGGWTQVIRTITGRPVISVDINRMKPIDGVIFIQGDIKNPDIINIIQKTMEGEGIEKIDVILSDAMVKTSGIGERDHYESYLLGTAVMEMALKLLSPHGNVVIKQFQGDETGNFINKWKQYYSFNKITKPRASRSESREIYIVFKDRI
ncbi:MULTISPECIES: RlmE family RNA methyltransferase [Acidiplasma]|jgi:23S rRNA (uridine2552-2'-O)-methyltransferase|uniref:Ribosomal RNA large subunit methyltransferase E n=2 Tax=Acidiplasma TaxID=507753 RepID=A0A0Q0XKB0_9ARCH|nr:MULTISPECIES: RlmE family RNA methyltransferase [Acidiplasma]KJE49499.1 23S rRNA methyltransferase [Acidiplasma sp. MBA-1]KPV46213.1 23S rRNA methyltransferase [Acidiplasma aeolicum]KQB33797.1 23S rRNA methyltransferase [Acidiplasma aeolicum]KQB35501.1 23S rRNA methyltransferase [Acidiplasma cupricumulans]WMT54516.1 MAG: RlmE family RNA methyltransferase [Acidiplasma sp.]